MNTRFADRIRPHVKAELAEAARAGDPAVGFRHLERAHVLGQASTTEHVRVHLHMLAWAVRQRCLSQMAGQLIRIIGAATKTVFGLVPQGNTGGVDISAFKSLPVPPDLARIIEAARQHP